jgi:acyl-CoA dehydrogenase
MIYFIKPAWYFGSSANTLLQMARSGLAGPGSSVTVGMAFGVPPILKFGNQQLQERFIPDLLRGKKRACIAITEPDAGSDVANIQTSAVKSKDGKHYIINGTKKWFVVLPSAQLFN